MKAALMFATAGLAIALATPAALAQTAPAQTAPGSPAAPSRSVASLQRGAQQAVPVDQLPTAVTAAVEKAYPKSTIVSAAKVSRGAQVMYQLSVKPAGDAQPIAVMASAEGMIRAGARKMQPPAGAPAAGRGQRKAPAASPSAQGETVAVNQLPKAVVQAIKDAYPKDVIIDAMRISAGPPVLYQLSLNDVSSLMPLRVVVSGDGKIQKR